MRSLAYLLKDLKLFLLMTIFALLFRREKGRNSEEIVITTKTQY